MRDERISEPAQEKYIGRSLRRLEDRRFLTGDGHFVDDTRGADELAAFVVRSPYAHARLTGIDRAAACASPGVVGVFTAEDLGADRLGPLPCTAHPRTVGPLVVPPRYALARDRVRHVGDPVALVVAATKNQARDGAERLKVGYEVLPAVVDAERALAREAPRIWEEAPGNLAYRFSAGDAEKTEAALRGAAHVAEITLANNRVIANPLEPRGAIGSYDASSATLHLLLSGQGVQEIRRELAEDVFHLPLERIQIKAPDVGGGFGMKNFLYPEWVLVLWAARRLGHPVRWIAERSEDFLSDTQGRATTTRARLGLDRAGRFLALAVATTADLGAYLSGYAPGVATNVTAMGGVYAIPEIAVEVTGAFTNTVPVDAYRGAGKPEANYLIERVIERAARELGRDPLELRRENVIATFSYRSATGTTIASGRFRENLAAAAKAADYRGFPARREAARARGRRRGIGLACYLETARGATDEWAGVHFTDDGMVELRLGTQSNGQGHETSFAQIAADMLGLPLTRFRFVQAETARVPRGNGHGGARSLSMGGTALAKAAEAVLAKGTRIAAHLLQAERAEVRFAHGRFAVPGRDAAGIDLLALARAARDPANLPPGLDPGLDTDVAHHEDAFTFPSGCHVAEVEVDPETGHVALVAYTTTDDFGRLINPMLTEGQVHGGVAQGIGQALLEHVVYEEGSGQLLSGSLQDYALPRADDLSAFDVRLAPLPSKVNPLGVKGSGQSGAMAAPQTIMHAILDALAPIGVHDLDMPATPERIWRAIRAASK